MHWIWSRCPLDVHCRWMNSNNYHSYQIQNHGCNSDAWIHEIIIHNNCNPVIAFPKNNLKNQKMATKASSTTHSLQMIQNSTENLFSDNHGERAHVLQIWSTWCSTYIWQGEHNNLEWTIMQLGFPKKLCILTASTSKNSPYANLIVKENQRLYTI
jgi:hypothetical protein